MYCGWTKRGFRASFVVAAVLGLVMTASAAAVASGPTGSAIQVPGTAALNADGSGAVSSVSCGATGNCAAGGYYTDANGYSQAFVASEVNGTWGDAFTVPGTSLPSGFTDAKTHAISCQSAGNCVAVGHYLAASGQYQAFIEEEKGGVWGSSEDVPGLAALNVDGYSVLNAVSCAAPGTCSAGGTYLVAGSVQQSFVVNEKNGIWAHATPVGNLAKISASSNELDVVSCSGPGNCAAGGWYTPSGGGIAAWVATEKGGVWGKAIPVPALSKLNGGAHSEIKTISCGGTGNCSAGGFYVDASGFNRAFAVIEKKGVWQKATAVQGLTTVAPFGAVLTSVSCRNAANCSAGGYYADANGYWKAFVVTEKNRVWSNAQTLNVPASSTSAITSLSCSAVGSCVAGGYWTDANGYLQAFAASEAHGQWGDGTDIPGATDLNAGGAAQVNSVSCAKAGGCAAGGFYHDASGWQQAFVTQP